MLWHLFWRQNLFQTGFFFWARGGQSPEANYCWNHYRNITFCPAFFYGFPILILGVLNFWRLINHCKSTGASFNKGSFIRSINLFAGTTVSRVLPDFSHDTTILSIVAPNKKTRNDAPGIRNLIRSRSTFFAVKKYSIKKDSGTLSLDHDDSDGFNSFY